MAVIFTSEHTSDRGREYKLEIIDTDGGTFIDELIVNQDGFRIEDTGGAKSLHETVVGKIVSFTIQVRNQDQEDFIVSLADDDEGRYLLKMYRDTNLKFIGVLTVDNVKIDNAPKPYDFKLEATDGLKLLKGVRYRSTFGTRAAATDGQQSMWRYINDCMKQLPTVGQYGSGDFFLSVATNWWSKEHIDNGQAANDMLTKTYTHWQTWGEEQNEYNFIFFDCYTILTAILEAFNCRMYYDEGHYRIEQIGLRDSATVDEIVYNAPSPFPSTDSMTQLGSSSTDYDIAIDQTDNFHLAGGAIKLLPPLRRVIVEYKINPNYSLLPTADPLNWERTTGYEALGYFNLTDESPTLTCDLKITSKFFNGHLQSEYRRVGWKFKLRVGSKVLSGYLGDMEWLDYSANPDAYLKLGFTEDLELPIHPSQAGWTFETVFDFTTPEITESGLINFDFYPAYSYYDGTDWVYEETPPPTDDPNYTNIEHRWWTPIAELYPTVNGEKNEEILTKSESSQSEGTGSVERSLKISDGFVVGRPGVLTVKTSAVDNKHVVTSGWIEGTSAGDYKRLPLMLGEAILSQRLKTLRIYHGSLYAKTDYISIRNRVVYDGYNLIFNRATLTTNFDEIKIEGIEVSVDTTGITNEEQETQPEILDGGTNVEGGDPINEDPDEPPTEGQEGLITDEILYKGDVITQFDVVEAEQDYFVTGDKIIIKDRLTGEEQEYVLTEPILNGDTVVHVESATVNDKTTIYSPVLFSPNESNRREDYELLQNTTGAPVDELEVTAFILPNPATYTAAEIAKKLKIYRQTAKLIYSVGYNIDFANNKLTFEWPVADQEYVEVFQK